MPETKNESPTSKVELIRRGGFTPELLDEISRFRRYIFNNAYGDFLVFPSTGKSISAQSFFDRDDYVNPDEMDSVKPEDLPCDEETGEKAIVYRQPKKIRQLTEWQLAGEDGHAAILRRGTEIAGLTYGYRTALRRIFELEWSNKYIYADTSPAGYERDWNVFLDKLNRASPFLAFDESTPAYCWNCLASDTESKGQGRGITREYFNHLMQDLEDIDLPLVADTLSNSRSHAFLRRFGCFEITGFLNTQKAEGEEIIVISSLKDIAKHQSGA